MNINYRNSQTASVLQAAVDNAPLIIWSVDVNGVITMSEGKGLQAVGLMPGQLVGQVLFDLYKDNSEAIAHVRRALNGETFIAEVRIGDKVYETHYSPSTDSSGTVMGAVGISLDSTKRWEAEQLQAYTLLLSDSIRPLINPQKIKMTAMKVLGDHLKVSRCYYAEITENGENCIIDNSYHSGIGGIDGRYRLSDFGKARVATLQAGRVIIADDVANDTTVTQAEREMNLVMQIHAYINVPLLKDGKLLCLLGINQSSPRKWSAFDLALVRETAERTWDAVERARADMKIQESEKQFKDIIEAIPQLVWVCNAAGEAVYFNLRWYQFTGSIPEQLLGHRWTALVHSDDIEQTLRKWDYARETATEFISEYRLRTADQNYRWVLARGVPIKDNDGNVNKWFGTCTDIHERKNFAEELERKVEERTAELNESNRLLQRSNEELEQFAYVSSHDLQEPLRKIQIFASRAVEEIHQRELATTYLSKVSSAASRMSSLVKDILQFSHASNTVQEFQTVDMNEIVEQIRVDFELLIDEKQAVIQADKLPRINASKVQITQLFNNLMSNALKFSNGKPLIKILYRQVDSETVPGTAHFKNFHYLCFSDNGIGFSQEHSDKIFKLFSRLHNGDNYKGTGIGLALCKKIVDNHKGMIYATSEKGSGTSFHIYLPIDILT